MNKKIKEILDYLKNKENDIKGINFLKYQELTRGEIDLLLDYITNLKQENERLKEANKVLEENWEHYMMRCGKALDKLTIKQARFINEKDYVLDDNDLDEIMVELQGEDKQ